MLSDYKIIWEQTHPVDWLRIEYALRRSRNESYSLRAFARFLRVPSGPLSEIMAKKRTLSVPLGKKICDRLGYNPAEQQKFLGLVQKHRRGRVAAPEPDAPEDPAAYRQLELDKFALMSDWYHFALLSLMETKDFSHDEKWIAARLGISTVEARGALECLSRLGMVQNIQGKWIGTGEWSTPHNVPSLAGRRFEKQGLQKASEALEHVPVEQRDITSITMAIDPAKLPQAKELIRRFRREMAQFLEQGERKEVYKLNVQLFPLSKNVEASS